MLKDRALPALAAFALAAIASILAFQSHSATASSPFATSPALTSIGALKETPFVVLPAVVNRVPADLRPAKASDAHQLGGNVVAWAHGDQVCVVTAAETGGCFGQFDRPVVLYLTGQSNGDGSYAGTEHATGIVPDVVRSLQIVTGKGSVVDTSVSNNGFDVELPAGTSISGVNVTLFNGTTFFTPDSVRPLPASLIH